MKKILNYIWELPQVLLGLIIRLTCGGSVYGTYKDITVYTWKFKSGAMSLGPFIFVPFKERELLLTYEVQETIRHEYGHSLQSKRLGWLYLLIIGIPSFVWAWCFGWYRFLTGTSYYGFYTEKWADQLGGCDENRSKKKPKKS